MATIQEEQQAKEFLKRAEIITMRKDLQKLREAEALKERGKIAKIKTFEEQKAEEQQKLKEKEAQIATKQQKAEESAVEKVLLEKEIEEKEAEKNIKQYATEQERQQIFILESERFELENKIKEIEEKKEAQLSLEKNKLLLKKRDDKARLNSILDQEKKLQDEQKFIAQKEQESNVPSEKKSLEKTRWEMDSKIQETEKKRWAAEKQIKDLEDEIKKQDSEYEKLESEKNSLQDKILGIDKSLRQIYSGVITQVQQKRKGQLEEQKIAREKLEKTRAEEKENIQRQQWRGQSDLKPPVKNKEFLSKAPESLKEKLAKTAAAEEEQRQKFLQDIEQQTKNEQNK